MECPVDPRKTDSALARERREAEEKLVEERHNLLSRKTKEKISHRREEVAKSSGGGGFSFNRDLILKALVLVAGLAVVGVGLAYYINSYRHPAVVAGFQPALAAPPEEFEKVKQEQAERRRAFLEEFQRTHPQGGQP